MVKLAAIQVSATPDTERNLRKAGQFLSAAAERGARVACFPALFSLPWFPREESKENFALAEALDGPLATKVARLAESSGIAVVCPFFERAPDGRCFNSAVLFDARGHPAGHYRKVHVPDIALWRERFYFAPGDLGFPVFELEGLKVGVQLCWDHFFPEGYRALALAGAQVVFVPTAAAFASQQRWLGTAVGHAVANGLFVVRVNRVGREPQQDFYGGSFCVRPDGDLSAEPIGVNEGVLLIECDPAETERARRTWPFLADRRPGEYGALVAGGETAVTPGGAP